MEKEIYHCDRSWGLFNMVYIVGIIGVLGSDIAAGCSPKNFWNAPALLFTREFFAYGSVTYLIVAKTMLSKIQVQTYSDQSWVSVSSSNI